MTQWRVFVRAVNFLTMLHNGNCRCRSCPFLVRTCKLVDIHFAVNGDLPYRIHSPAPISSAGRTSLVPIIPPGNPNPLDRTSWDICRGPPLLCWGETNIPLLSTSPLLGLDNKLSWFVHSKSVLVGPLCHIYSSMQMNDGSVKKKRDLHWSLAIKIDEANHIHRDPPSHYFLQTLVRENY